jgi:hypothetical protein
MSGKGELPATYLFKTREGGAGVLQIVGFTDKPWAVKIRYKLARKPMPAVATALCELDAVLRQSGLEARRRGDKDALQRMAREIAADMKSSEEILKGTVAEIPWNELNERGEDWRKAVAGKSQKKEIDRLAEELRASAAAVNRLINKTEMSGPRSAGGQ